MPKDNPAKYDMEMPEANSEFEETGDKVQEAANLYMELSDEEKDEFLAIIEGEEAPEEDETDFEEEEDEF